jgi:predicted RNase H-like HicB family nuclease
MASSLSLPPTLPPLSARVFEDHVDHVWIAECQELPGAMSQGDTPAEALANLADAIGGILSVRMRQHLEEAPPVEAVSGRVVELAL